jgi:hypothetical protein
MSQDTGMAKGEESTAEMGKSTVKQEFPGSKPKAALEAQFRAGAAKQILTATGTGPRRRMRTDSEIDAWIAGILPPDAGRSKVTPGDRITATEHENIRRIMRAEFAGLMEEIRAPAGTYTLPQSFAMT